MTTYILDSTLTPAESTRIWVGNQTHACAPKLTRGFYKYAIRRDDEPDSWVFRFSSIQGVGETLAGLNDPVVLEAVA